MASRPKTSQTAKKAIASVKLANRNVNQSLKLTKATGKVIAARADLARKGLNVNAGDLAEFSRIVPEKAVAFGTAGLNFIQHATQMASEIAANGIAEWDALRRQTLAVSQARSPVALALAQGQGLWERWERLIAQSVNLGSNMMRAQFAVMAPIQSAASGNERRLYL